MEATLTALRDIAVGEPLTIAANDGANKEGGEGNEGREQ